MFSSRAVVRASRGVRGSAPAVRQNIRRYAEAPHSQGSGSGSSGSATSPYLGGAIGGAAASLLVFTLWYQFSGIGKAARSMKQAKSYVESATEQLKVQFKENTPEPSEAIETLKQSAYKYAAFIPGGREYVDKVFKDLEIIRNKHGEEVDNIVKDAYGELRDAAKNGLNLETVSNTWSILSKYLQKLSSLAVDAGQDILDNHPELKNQLGGSFDQLKQFGETLGPEAKKQVDQAYKDIQDIVNQGFNWNTIDKIRKIAQEKVEALKQLRDKAWEQGYEQIQPMIKNNPQVKKLVEENADTLKNGNVTEALDKIKQALSSGDIGNLDEYVKSAMNKADQFSSSSISKWLGVIPGGSQILPQLQKLRQVAESRGPEAEKLAKETMGDIKEILDKRSSQVEDLYNKAQKEAKN